MLFVPRASGVSHLQVAGPPERVKLVPASDGADDAEGVYASGQDMRPWIVDSGASFHVVSQRDLKCLKCRRQQQVPGGTRIRTANRSVVVSDEVEVYVEQLHCWLWCRVMPQCPRLLSLGLL